MKKVFSILMVAFAMTAMVACGDKNEGTENNGGNNNGGGNNEQTTRLSGAKYYRQTNSAGDMTEHTVTFGQGNEVKYHVVWNWSEGGSNYAASGDETWRGTYTYTEGGQGNNWNAEGKFTMSKVGDSYSHYETTYYADGDNLKLFNALPNGDIINLAKEIH